MNDNNINNNDNITKLPIHQEKKKFLYEKIFRIYNMT